MKERMNKLRNGRYGQQCKFTPDNISTLEPFNISAYIYIYVYKTKKPHGLLTTVLDTCGLFHNS